MSSASESQIAYLSRDLEVIHSPIFHFSICFAGDPFAPHLVRVDPVLQPAVRQRCCGTREQTCVARVLGMRTHEHGVKCESLKQYWHTGSKVQMCY